MWCMMNEIVKDRGSSLQKRGFFARLKTCLQKTRDSLASVWIIWFMVRSKSRPGTPGWIGRGAAYGRRWVSSGSGNSWPLARLGGRKRIRTKEEIRQRLQPLLMEILEENKWNWNVPESTLQVILVIGINKLYWCWMLASVRIAYLRLSYFMMYFNW